MARVAWPVLAAAVALVAFLLGVMAYEQLALGWHFAREDVPGDSAYFWLRGAVNATLSFALVWSLSRTAANKLPPLSQTVITLSWAVMAAAAAALALLAADPALYQLVGAEDGAIEWLTALLLLLASVGMALKLRQSLRTGKGPWRRLHIIGAVGFAALFFLMAGEEVSWFQRVVGFDTPDVVAQRNWQGEFNFHNFQTDLTELALYTGTGIFLMLLPLVRAALGHWRIVAPIRNLLPDHSVAALSAPMLIFTYSHWNLLPVRSAFFIGLAVCLAFALLARRDGKPGEARLWTALTIFVALGQILHLALGHTMVAMYDSSEYRELFLALGLAAYGWQQWRSARA
ncbi:hypothetical protein [Qipengyuania marisflavi]|uniref:Uncharacterized protein n=1 Tax=Qipengyuania marisflavi TaxID=2486356 RepID=A0A5S3P6R6_9SPHN|nr:hypothetical protein [Qipengyuania marisflavi]TMM48921.1 hypothetical protein FEV51_05955 [Qipengyuania marisflavi]